MTTSERVGSMSRIRGPTENVVIEVTERCNHACAHCYNYWRSTGRGRGPGDLLTVPDICELICKVKAESALRNVAVSGGEPLLRPDLPEIVAELTGLDLGVVVITNGTLLTEGLVRRFPPRTAFEITLFSANENLHNRLTGCCSFERVLENIVRLRRYGHSFVLAFVITKLNAPDVESTIRLGVALGAEGVLLNRINLSRHVMPQARQLVPARDQLRQCLSAADDFADRYEVPIMASVPIPPCVADPVDFPHLQFGWCPRGGKDAYYTIGCTGLLRPCNHSSVVLGDLCRERFSEIVNRRSTREFWAPVPRVCRQCRHPLKAKCRGGCPAAADECTGSRTQIDPFVPICNAQPCD